MRILNFLLKSYFLFLFRKLATQDFSNADLTENFTNKYMDVYNTYDLSNIFLETYSLQGAISLVIDNEFRILDSGLDYLRQSLHYDRLISLKLNFLPIYEFYNELNVQINKDMRVILSFFGDFFFERHFVFFRLIWRM